MILIILALNLLISGKLNKSLYKVLTPEDKNFSHFTVIILDTNNREYEAIINVKRKNYLNYFIV